MKKRMNNMKWFQLSLTGICLVISLLPANGIEAENITPTSGPEVGTGPETLQPIYFTPEQMKEMGGPVMTFRAPLTPLKLDPSTFPQVKPLTELPDWVKIPKPSQELGQ